MAFPDPRRAQSQAYLGVEFLVILLSASKENEAGFLRIGGQAPVREPESAPQSPARMAGTAMD